MPAHTDARIHQLCTEALAAKTQADVNRIIPELRSALEEHIRLAKESLAAQVSNIVSLDAAAQAEKDLPEA
jgi:hypothetical protein